MLPHYTPLKVAEVFRTLHALYPGRVDLGIGRAPGGGPVETLALKRERKTRMPDDFPDQVSDETCRLLEHGLAQAVVEHGEDATIDRLLRQEVAVSQPLAEEFLRKAAHLRIADHAANLLEVALGDGVERRIDEGRQIAGRRPGSRTQNGRRTAALFARATFASVQYQPR